MVAGLSMAAVTIHNSTVGSSSTLFIHHHCPSSIIEHLEWNHLIHPCPNIFFYFESNMCNISRSHFASDLSKALHLDLLALIGESSINNGSIHCASTTPLTWKSCIFAHKLNLIWQSIIRDMIEINQLQHLAVILRKYDNGFQLCISGSAKNSDSSIKLAHGNAMNNCSFAFVTTHVLVWMENETKSWKEILYSSAVRTWML